MFNIKRKTGIILAAIMAVVVILGIVVWVFFPVILRNVFPTMYTYYALSRTAGVLSDELSEIGEFFDFPDLSDSDVKRLSVELDGISAGLGYGRWDATVVNLPKLSVGIELLHDREAKQASLDLYAGWDNRTILLTLFTNVEQVAFGLGDNASWVVDSKDFGKELARLGLPVHEEMELDLGFLFPDVISDEERADALKIFMDFSKSLRFRRNKNTDFPIGFEGSAMTTVIDGESFRAFLHDLMDSPFGKSSMNAEILESVLQSSGGDHELTFFIGKDNIIQAVQADFMMENNSMASVMIQLTGEQNMLDGIIIEVNISNDLGRRSYSIESNGRHVPVGGVFTNTTIFRGFDFGEIQLDTEINNNGALSIAMQSGSFTTVVSGLYYTTSELIGVALNTVEVHTPYGFLSLDGGLNLEFGNAATGVRDITINAYNLADFEWDFAHFRLLFQIVWEVLLQDQTLMDMFGQQFIDLVLRSLLGDQLGSFIMDLLGDQIVEVMDLLITQIGDVADLIGDIIREQIGNIGDAIGDLIEDIVPERLRDLLDEIFRQRIPD